jgi:hypothetical protein
MVGDAYITRLLAQMPKHKKQNPSHYNQQVIQDQQ